MRKVKIRKHAITPSLAGFAGWLFIVTIIIGGVFALPQNEEVQSQNLTDEVLGEMVMVAPSQAAVEAEIAYIKKHGKKEKHHPGRIMLHTDRLFDPIIFQAANRYDVEPALVKAIIMAESGYNSKAVSDKGARGLMQLMPATAEMLGVEDYYHPEDNINAGVKYFKQLLNQFDNDVELALAAYNAGCGRVKEYQGVPPYKATQEYIKKVFEYYEFYKEQMSST